MAHQAPARGVMEGIRNDLKRSQDNEGEYRPNGVGHAYSHNFLNQKPWHPANFRNQARVYEAQQKHLTEEKARQQAKAEFQAEQEYLKTLSYLGPDEEQKFKERQGVQFLYMKPPGADDTLPRAPKLEQPEVQPDAQTHTQNAAWPLPPADQNQHSSNRSHVGNMLSAMRSLQNHDMWEVKHVSGICRSPTRGVCQPDSDNQQFLVSSPESEAGVPSKDIPPRCKGHVSKESLAEAKEVLRRANINMSALKAVAGKRQKKAKRSEKRKRHRKRVQGAPK